MKIEKHSENISGCFLKFLFEQLPQLPDLKDTEALVPFLPLVIRFFTDLSGIKNPNLILKSQP
ncbi:hypothetical protein BSK52_00390 [Paenibacillus odorifer]|uniref:Uncharacterized protein n=1 Tax=Paenibacillus odorifer TaxID=189426 RepID=A0A1R0Y9T4_9BACL|nr:hypothetical protein BSK52_00390 [Paenibacillus odorifer]